MDEQLKRRLVGAAIIMLLAVVVVPLFFEDKSPKDPSALPEAMQEHPLALPPEDSAGAAPTVAEESAPIPTPATGSKKRKYEVVPLDDAPARPVKVEPAPQDPAPSAVSTTPVESAPYSEDEVENTAPAPRVVRGPAAPSSKPKTATRKPAATMAESQPAKPKAKSTATEPRSRAESAPTPSRKSENSPATKPVRTTTSTTANKPAPTAKATDAPAKKAATPVSTSSGTTAKKSATTPPATKPKQSAEGKAWTVQAGTFADESNARNLVEKLKKRNLPAKVHAVEGSSGKVYRVTVGSGLERDHAEKIQKQLSTKDGVNGVILQNR